MMRDAMTNVRYLPSPRIKNPFRPFSKKALCFEMFLKGGSRQELLAAMETTGVKWSTAQTWIHYFRVYVSAVRVGRKLGAEGGEDK